MVDTSNGWQGQCEAVGGKMLPEQAAAVWEKPDNPSFESVA